MKNYSKAIKNIPQSQPIPGQNMVKNNAGGFSFEISSQERLERFLLIGSEGGTYYVSEQKLTVENADAIIKYIKQNGIQVVETVIDFAINRRAPKADAGLFVLALAVTHGDEDTKQRAYGAISKVCKTATQLFTFMANIQNLRGWSRGLRNGVAKFYTGRTPDQVAYQMVKYRNRAGFTHKDALRLSHPKAADSQMNEIFKYGVGKQTEAETPNALINAFGKAQTADSDLAVQLIQEEGITWEMLPTELLNNAEVLKVLAQHMPLTALIRNLNRFSYNGLTDKRTATVKTIVSRLNDEELVKKAGIHPLNVINSMMTYSSGHGQKGGKTWTPNQDIVDALGETYNLALKALTPTGKKILVAVDVSGSMSNAVNGMSMSAAQIANVLALTILKSESESELIWFDTEVQKPKIGRRTSVDEAIRLAPHGGGTDCAQALIYAADNLESYDAIIILTDNETWAGRRHGLDVLNSYRRTVNRDVKVVEVAMVANPSSNLPEDKNVLRVVGFDASVVDVINTFIG